MRSVFTVASFALIRRGPALAVLLMLAVAGVVGCGATTSADVKNCLSSSVVSLEKRQGEPRTYDNLELTVSCSPKHPFELAEVSESGDYPVLAVHRGGTNTCLHRLLKAKGDKCAIELEFDPGNQPGDYATDIYFQYAKENEVFIAPVTGVIQKA